MQPAVIRLLALFISAVVVSDLAWASSVTLSKPFDQSDDADQVSVSHQHFKSSNATPPVLQIEKSGQPLAPGFLVFVPESRLQAALLMTDDGDLIWSSPSEDTIDLRVQQLHGKSVLSRWIGVSAPSGYSYGQLTILDNTYSKIHVICPQFGLFIPKFPTIPHRPKCEADNHEAFFTHRNTIIVTAYNITRADMRSVGGPKNGWVLDGQFYEIDIKTQRVVFKWTSLQHVPLKKSVNPVNGTGKIDTDAYDYFHINSVQRLRNGNYIVSGRYTSTIYLIGPTGRIIFEFNGYNGGDFRPTSNEAHNNSHFAFQHDPRAHHVTEDGLTLHFFNNDNSEVRNGSHPSTGLEFRLNTKKNTSTLLRRLYDPSELLYSETQGNFWPLPNGNVIIGYGSNPVIKEFGPSGGTDVRMTVRFGKNIVVEGYRAYRQKWHATPAAPPDVAIDAKSSKGWVSWNGATEVTKYIIYAGHKKSHLHKVNEVQKRGFETEFDLEKDRGYVQVAAYKGEKFLRNSKVMHVA